MDYTDIIAFLQASNFLKKLRKALTNSANEMPIHGEFAHFFTEIGLTFENNTAYPNRRRPDASFPDCIVDFKHSRHFTEGRLQAFLASTASTYIQGFITRHGIPPRWLVLISDDMIIYCHHTDDGGVSEFTRVPLSNESLASLCVCLQSIKVMSPANFSSTFGYHSGIYSYMIQKIATHFASLPNRDDYYNIWRKLFYAFYPTHKLTKDSFFRSCYLTALIDCIWYVAASDDRDVIAANHITELQPHLAVYGIPVFDHDFFTWIREIPELADVIFHQVKRWQYEPVDVFRIIYEHFNDENDAAHEDRHTAGEYYTPAELAHMIIRERYRVGMTVLDPSCGSGTFLVEIVRYILNSGATYDEKYQALKRIYGIDINPIAVHMAKANIALIYKTMCVPKQHWMIRILLGNAIEPIQRGQTDLQNTHKLAKFTITNGDSIIIHIPIDLLASCADAFVFFMSRIDDLLSRNYAKASLIAHANELLQLPECRVLVPHHEFLMAQYIPTLLNISSDWIRHLFAYQLHNAVSIYTLRHGVDLLIGNPPWVILRKLPTLQYKNVVKSLATTLNITPSAGMSAFDVSNIFIYQTSRYFCHPTSLVSFVLPKTIASSRSASFVRRFDWHTTISVWLFEKKLVFPVPHLVLHLTYNDTVTDYDTKYPLPTVLYNVTYDTALKQFIFTEETRGVIRAHYKPRSREVGAWNMMKDGDESISPLPYIRSVYYTQAKVGIQLSPRALITHFSKTVISDNEVVIRLQEWEVGKEERVWYNLLKSPPNSLSPRQINALNDYMTRGVIVHPKYIFKYILLDDLLAPYQYRNPGNEVLLLMTPSFEADDDALATSSLTTDWWTTLEALYATVERTERKTMLHSICGHSVDVCQKPFKVIWPKSGALRAAVVCDPTLVIGNTLYAIGTSRKAEAYYLAAMINSSIIAEAVATVKSARDLTRHAFDFPIPRFDPNNSSHTTLACLAEQCTQDPSKIDDLADQINEVAELLMLGNDIPSDLLVNVPSDPIHTGHLDRFIIKKKMM